MREQQTGGGPVAQVAGHQQLAQEERPAPVCPVGQQAGIE
jgi:hypothetical protein